MDLTDTQLLAQFIADRSEQAFRALAERHADLVYAAARRQVHDPGLAEDVAQGVFIVLARKAASVDGSRLAGWLLGTTRYVAQAALRAQARRIRHEQEAAAMKACQSNQGDPNEQWKEISGHVDEALSRLNESDRTAIALRYLEDRPLRSVADAMGINEEAARKRVGRALEKLRSLLPSRGMSSVAIASAITLAAAEKAPAGLTSASTTFAMTGASASPALFAKGAMNAMTFVKIKFAAAIALATLIPIGATVSVVQLNTAEPPGAQPAAVQIPAATQPGPNAVQTNDLLSISIKGLVGDGAFTVTPRVDSKGMITLPGLSARSLVGSRRGGVNIPPPSVSDQIVVAGSDLRGIEEIVRVAYRNARMLENAEVAVKRLETAANASVQSGPIGEGDVLRIQIADLASVGKATTVEAQVIKGDVEVPMIGAIWLEDQTEAEATRIIVFAFRNKQLLANATVEVVRIKVGAQKP